MIGKIIGYLKNPIPKVSHSGSHPSIKEFMALYFSCLLCIAISIVVMFAIDQVIVHKFFGFSIRDSPRSGSATLRQSQYFLIVVLLLGPLVEEIIFRLPLRLRKINLGLAVFIATFWILHSKVFPLDFYAAKMYQDFGLSVLTVGLVWLAPVRWLQTVQTSYFKYFFYFSVIAFGLMHISNFTTLNTEVLFFYPIYVLPQLVMGIFLGYIRIRYSFLYAYIFHALTNLPAALLM